MDYSKYTVEDFLLNERFRNWVFNPEKGDNLFWEDWLDKNPSRSGILIEARNILLNLAMHDYDLSVEEKSELWETIDKMSASKDEILETKVIPINPYSVLQNSQLKEARLYRNYQWLRIAGIILVIAIFSGVVANWPAENETGAAALITKATDWGVKSQVTLGDGTVVTLNSGSKLKYLPNFSDSSRDVYLEGEAYFSVAKDHNRPFKVHAGNIVTTALGTEFNVNAYQDNRDETLVALLEGKVQVEKWQQHNTANEKHILLPGEMLLYNRERNSVNIQEFNEKEIVAWKEGNLYFAHAEKTEVFKRIERWYGVDFIFTNSDESLWDYSAEFQNQSLLQVLTSLSFTKSFKFQIKNSTVYITFINL